MTSLLTCLSLLWALGSQGQGHRVRACVLHTHHVPALTVVALSVIQHEHSKFSVNVCRTNEWMEVGRKQETKTAASLLLLLTDYVVYLSIGQR